MYPSTAPRSAHNITFTPPPPPPSLSHTHPLLATSQTFRAFRGEHSTTFHHLIIPLGGELLLRLPLAPGLPGPRLSSSDTAASPPFTSPRHPDATGSTAASASLKSCLPGYMTKHLACFPDPRVISGALLSSRCFGLEAPRHLVFGQPYSHRHQVRRFPFPFSMPQGLTRFL